MARKTAKYNVLIVDDDEDMCLSLADVISLDRDYRTFFTSAPGKAIELVRKKNFSLVLMDYKMPGINGIEAMRAMKKIRPGLPVIILTAFISKELIAEAKKEGASEVLSKFIWPDELLNQLEKVISKSG